MARYSGDQEPTLFDLIEAGADDNVDLILAQLFDDQHLADLRGALRSYLARAEETRFELASKQRPLTHAEVEQMAGMRQRCARLGALIDAVEGHA